MKKIITILTAIFMAFSLVFPVTTPVFAAEGLSEEDCAILNCNQSIEDILTLVVDIMTIGIGILGVVGITIVGIQYLTAGGSEEKTRKAKRRMFEIIIGLIAYVVIYTFLRWLLPSFDS